MQRGQAELRVGDMGSIAMMSQAARLFQQLSRCLGQSSVPQIDHWLSFLMNQLGPLGWSMIYLFVDAKARYIVHICYCNNILITSKNDSNFSCTEATKSMIPWDFPVCTYLRAFLQGTAQ